MKNENAKFTPGPWEIQHTAKGTDLINAPKMGPGHYHVAEVFGVDSARIAAAPELLAALKQISDRLDKKANDSNPDALFCYSVARAALAKAKGE